MSDQDTDVLVVGGSLAGCATAVLMARMGARVTLLERHARPQAHKALCTHFIQASAWPALSMLGLDRLIEEAGGLRNAIELHTPHGWIGDHLGASPDGGALHGYNIRRAVLDPLVRQLAASTPGVTVLTGMSARQVIMEGDSVVGVQAEGQGVTRRWRARLVVAADGRASELATQAGAPLKTSPNTRHALAVPMRQVGLRRGLRSQMWMTGPEVLYSFPNDDGVTVLAWMAPQAQMAPIDRAQALDALRARLAQMPDAPDLTQAVPDGECMKVKDFPNQWRPPVWHGMALVGDAAASLDYMHGVGCGWAFQTAAWLAETAGPNLHAPQALAQGLQAYARRHEAMLGRHRFFIHDFARRLDFNPVERLLFAAAARDPACAHVAMRVAARMDSPWSLLSPANLWRSLRAVGRTGGWRSGTADTRLPLRDADLAWPAAMTQAAQAQVHARVQA